MAIHLEDYLPNEQEEVKNFILKTWKEFGFVYMPEYDSDLDDPEKYYIKPGGMFYVLKDEDKIIGTLGIINKGDAVAELKRFYIEIDYRGRGYGTQLFNKALEFCRKKAFNKIEFETGKAFKQGHAFYKNKGFNILKEDKDSYFMEKFI